ncbi:hypothetical protein CBS101457_003936 [Exobasidium rhododendri]|nr:hypothetical protein CBS101457_003936 [Exobasidium rhododendri]
MIEFSDEGVLIRFVKFRAVPKTTAPFQSGDSLIISSDRIRTYVYSSQDVQKGMKRKRKISVEILLECIEQVDYHTAKDATSLVFFTKQPIISSEGDVISDVIAFYFQADGKSTTVGGEKDLEVFCQVLQERGVNVVLESSGSSQSQHRSSPTGIRDVARRPGLHLPAKKAGEAYDEDCDASESQLVEELQHGEESVPPIATRSRSQSPTGQLDGEIHIPSSQPNKKEIAMQRRGRIDDDTDDGSDDNVTNKHTPCKKQKVDARADPEDCKELNKCLKDINKCVAENWRFACVKAKTQRKQLQDQLWRKFRLGIDQPKRKSINVEHNLSESVNNVVVHSQEFQKRLMRGKDDLAWVDTKVKDALKNVEVQQARLTQLTQPFQK